MITGERRRVRPLARHRLAGAAGDLRLVQRAGPAIIELGTALDRRLLSEPRPNERMRLLREATNRIIRHANDAVQAYRRARRTIEVELGRSDADAEAAATMRKRLEASRLDVLRALDDANRRYPWTEDDVGSAYRQPARERGR